MLFHYVPKPEYFVPSQSALLMIYPHPAAEIPSAVASFTLASKRIACRFVGALEILQNGMAALIWQKHQDKFSACAVRALYTASVHHYLPGTTVDLRDVSSVFDSHNQTRKLSICSGPPKSIHILSHCTFAENVYYVSRSDEPSSDALFPLRRGQSTSFTPTQSPSTLPLLTCCMIWLPNNAKTCCPQRRIHGTWCTLALPPEGRPSREDNDAEVLGVAIGVSMCTSGALSFSRRGMKRSQLAQVQRT